MSRHLSTLVLAVLLSAFTTEAGAQVVAPGGRTLFNRGVMVRSFARLDSFDEGPTGLNVRRLVNVNAVVWGAYPHLSLSFVVPVVSLDRSAAGDPATDGRTTGTADGSIFARYDAYRKPVPSGFTRLGAEVGIKLPTGSTFGSGSTDYIGSLIFSHVREPNWLVTDAQFTSRTTGDERLRQGDRWRYDVAYLRQVLPRRGLGVPGVLLVVELNAESVGRAREDGQVLPDTGGDVVYLSPGVQVFAARRLVLEFSVPLQIHADLNGQQIEPSHSFIAGFRWLM